MDPRQLGAIAQAAQPQQLDPRAQRAMMEMVRGQGKPNGAGMSVPLPDRARMMEKMRGQVGDTDMNELIESLLTQEGPMLEAQQGGIGGLMELIKSKANMQPQMTPQQMLEQIQMKKQPAAQPVRPQPRRPTPPMSGTLTPGVRG